MEGPLHFKSFLDMLPMLGFILDEDGRLIYVNRALLQKFEQPAEHFLGRDASELYPPEVAKRLNEHNREALAGAVPVERREQVPTSDGVLREWWTLRVPFRDAEGRAFLGCLALDLSERTLMEEALRRSEERYRSLWQRNLAGIVRATLSGRILDCNESFAQLFGYPSREALLTRSTTDFYFDLGVREEFVARLRESGTLTNYEMCMRRADGIPIWVLENVTLRIEDGEEILEGTLIDITERKRIEEALRSSEATYRTLVENLDQAIFFKDRELRYVAANPVFCAGVGRTESELRGKAIAELFQEHPLIEKSKELERRVLEEGRPNESEDTFNIHGEQRQLRVCRTPVRDPDGAIVGVLGIGWDVTDERAREAQVRHVQKMDAIGQLAGGIAHEFNNLLTIMLGNLNLALKEGTDPAHVRELVRNAEKAGLRAAEVTRTLLGFSRQASLASIPIDLHQVVDDVLALMRPMLPRAIQVSFEHSGEPALVQADPGLMQQMVANLTLNARDAMTHGGTIAYQISTFVPDPEYLHDHVEAREGSFIRLRIRDTGAGMTPDVKQRIFEPFFTTKEKGKGTGLGLAIVFSIVKQHGGWIVCESEPRRGTTFEVFLPRSNVLTAPSSPVSPPEAREPIILLVDDEKMIRQLATTVLSRAGFQVLDAENGEKAVEIFRARHAEIALVLLDAVMPRLSGRDTLRRLAPIDPTVPVLFCSGYSSEQVDLREFPQVRGFLAKPYRADQLIQRISEIVKPPAKP